MPPGDTPGEAVFLAAASQVIASFGSGGTIFIYKDQVWEMRLKTKHLLSTLHTIQFADVVPPTIVLVSPQLTS